MDARGSRYGLSEGRGGGYCAAISAASAVSRDQ